MNISEQPLYVRATFYLLLAGLIIAFSILAKNILIPLTIAIVFTFLLLPVSTKLQQWHLPKALAIIISIIIALAFFVALIYFFYSQVVSFANDWPELQKALEEKWKNVQQFISETFNVSHQEQQVWLKSKISRASFSLARALDAAVICASDKGPFQL
jgi:predicted PurR-regulated permease PerM